MKEIILTAACLKEASWKIGKLDFHNISLYQRHSQMLVIS